MVIKFLVLFLVLLFLIFLGSLLLRKSINSYNPKTWFITEIFWLSISFSAVCAGLIEIERLEKMNTFKEKEKQLMVDYESKKNLLAAQTFILKLDSNLSEREAAGVKWFHKMKALFDEGINTNRWEGFLFFTRSYVIKEPGCYADLQSNALEYGWPEDPKMKEEDIFLKEEIVWVVDSLKSFQKHKDNVAKMKPEEITNYLVRYTLIGMFLLGLSLKVLRTYSDYKSKVKTSGSF
ncbi:MAG: hypothetical protein JNL60_15490 [Bacteroidia bacterium]|nr:hypothetical protein [Bacteroidia bacterium]